MTLSLSCLTSAATFDEVALRNLEYCKEAKTMATSKITVKFQASIPKEVRSALGVSVNDVLQWTVRAGVAQVVPATSRLLDRRGSLRVGRGSTVKDVRAGRASRGTKGVAARG